MDLNDFQRPTCQWIWFKLFDGSQQNARIMAPLLQNMMNSTRRARMGTPFLCNAIGLDPSV